MMDMCAGTAFPEALEARELGRNPLPSVDMITYNKSRALYQRDVKGHTGCVNALEFSRDENFLLSGGDDCRVFLWDSHDLTMDLNPKPRRVMNTVHYSNIFAVDFSSDGLVGYSAGNDRVFNAHDLETGQNVYSLLGRGTFHRVNAHPISPHISVATNEAGRFHVIDVRAKEESNYSVDGCLYSVMYNPLHPELLLTATKRNGVAVRDVRQPTENVVSWEQNTKRSTFARWSPSGESIAVVVSSAGLLYINCFNNHTVELNDPEYINSCTMKSCEFVNEDYVLCGSDKWDIYAWKVPEDDTVTKVEHTATVLKGHRSIVNHIRHSAMNNIIASSGVEKIVKVWSAFDLPLSYRNPPRREMLQSFSMNPLVFSHDPDSVEEDLGTLGQFDEYLRHAMSNDCESISTSTDEDDNNSQLREMLRYAMHRFNSQFADNDDNSDSDYANEVQPSDSSSDDDHLHSWDQMRGVIDVEDSDSDEPEE